MVISFALATPVQAQISPGKLAAPHADLEGIRNCVKCHELGSGPRAKRCLDCHREIEAGIKAKKGLHFQYEQVQKKLCFKCHSEHAGRNFQLIRWQGGQKNFDHSQTGFELQGKHSTLKCRDCHQPKYVKTDLKKLQPKIDLKKTFLGLNRDCLACHLDMHRGQQGRDCLKCHNQKKWQPATGFDHNRARFVLTGKHVRVACGKCHPTVRDPRPPARNQKFYLKYVGLEFRSCAACHKDVHKGKLGSNCRECHSTRGWKQFSTARFDHSKARFPLRGLHKRVDCRKCHTSGDMTKPLRFSSCVFCHKDVHKGKFGRDCKQCHSENGWKRPNRATFDHAKTDFALRGKHQRVACEKCHTSGSMLTPLRSERCEFCHTDVHLGQFKKRTDGGNCQACHNEQGFLPAQFGVPEHRKTRFALEGAHLATPCIACHKLQKRPNGKAVRRFAFSTVHCETCHRDVHFGQFTRSKPLKNCENCHTVSEWQGLVFNHEKDSRFPLQGAHRTVACSGCHKKVKVKKRRFILYRQVPMHCENCHTPGGMKLKQQRG